MPRYMSSPIATESRISCLTYILNSKFFFYDLVTGELNFAISISTEEFITRFDRKAVAYSLNQLGDVDWPSKPSWLEPLFTGEKPDDRFQIQLNTLTIEQLDALMGFCADYHLDRQLFWTFDAMLGLLPLSTSVPDWLDRHPPLAFSLLKHYPPDASQRLAPEIASMGPSLVRNIIRSANDLGIASLVALEKISLSIYDMAMVDYLELLELAALSVHASNLVQEVMLVLNDSRAPSISQSDLHAYVHKHALAISFD